MGLFREFELPLWWFDEGGGSEEESSEDASEEEEEEEKPEEEEEDEDKEKKRIYDKEVEEALKTLEDVEKEELDDPEALKVMVKRTAKALQVLANSNEKLSDLARKRLHEIMEKKQKLRDYVDKEEKVHLDDLKEKEKYKEALDLLQPKYDTLKQDVAKTREHLEREFDELKAELPEEYHGLIPPGDVRVQISWIQKFQKAIVEPAASGSGGKEDEEESGASKKANASFLRVSLTT